MTKVIISNQPIVNVEKQDIQFPTSANRPIAVRLSDGKSFYNAIAAIGGGGISKNANANLEKLTFDVSNNLKVTGGSSGSTTVDTGQKDVFNQQISAIRNNDVEIDYSDRKSTRLNSSH